MTTQTPHPPTSARGRPADAPAPGRQGRGPSRDFGRLLIGAVVVTLGVLFLLDSAGTLDAGRAIGRWWPVAIIAAGLLTLAERPPAPVRGVVVAGAGVLLLLFTTDVLGEDAWNYVWPAALVLVGLAIVARWRGRAEPETVAGDDVMRCTAVLSGSEMVSAAPVFRGALLTAIFGGIVLDLRNSRPAPGGASVNATAIFGGVDLLVPKGWRITVRSMPVLGGVDDHTDTSVPVAPDAPELRVDAVSIFGGVSIKHEK